MPTEIVRFKDGPESRAAAEFVDTCRTGRTFREQVEHQASFMAGIRWERERWRRQLAAELTRVSNVQYPAKELAEHFVLRVETKLGVGPDKVRCPHGCPLENLRDGTDTCAAGCK